MPARPALPLLAAALLAATLPAVPLADARTRTGSFGQRLRSLEPRDEQSEKPPLFEWDGQFVSLLGLESTRQGGRTIDTLYNKSALGVRLALPEGFSVSSTLRLEPVPGNPDSQLLPRHAAWAETLTLRWTEDPIRLFAGKIHPRFGAAWSRAPGLYGADYAQDYELREKIGFGARLWVDEVLDLPDPLGYQSLQVEAFQADTTALSASAFNPRWTDASGTLRQRWRASRLLGGADNRGGLPGVTVSWVGTEVEIPGGQLGFNAGASFRQPGLDASLAGRAAQEVGTVAGAEAAFPLPGGVTLAPAAEVARRDANGGYANRRAEWLTAALTLRRGALSLSYVEMAKRERDGATGERGQGRQRTAGVALDLGRASGVALLQNTLLTLDWRRRVELGERTEGFGTTLVYSISF